MKQKHQINNTESPLAGGSFYNWLLLWKDNNTPHAKYFGRVMFITLMTLLFLPLRMLHKIVFNRKINATKMEKDPVFMLGHFRSGGTYLTNLLTQDKQWGFISTTQAILPETFLFGKPMSKILGLFLHKKRPMDNVSVSPELPEEPEHAICNLVPIGFFHGLCYPDRMMEYFRNSVLFEDDSLGEKQRMWRSAYIKILKACTLKNKGKQLLIKNPPDTARVPLLLKLFPAAKFIFLYRNPFVMFPSSLKFYKAHINDWQLRDITNEQLDENTLEIYNKIMANYQRDKNLIPSENLVEIKFEDVEANPLQQVNHIYEQFKISGFADSVPAFEEYILSQKNYKKNRYQLTNEQVEKIKQRWTDDIQSVGYSYVGAVDIID